MQKLNGQSADIVAENVAVLDSRGDEEEEY